MAISFSRKARIRGGYSLQKYFDGQEHGAIDTRRKQSVIYTGHGTIKIDSIDWKYAPCAKGLPVQGTYARTGIHSTARTYPTIDQRPTSQS